MTTPGGPGFRVDIPQLRTYSGQLAGHKSTVQQANNLVNTADVSDQSWGIIGIVVKQFYTGMLEDLRSLLTDMDEGLQSASDKVTAAADIYQRSDDDSALSWQELTGTVDGTVAT